MKPNDMLCMSVENTEDFFKIFVRRRQMGRERSSGGGYESTIVF